MFILDMFFVYLTSAAVETNPIHIVGAPVFESLGEDLASSGSRSSVSFRGSPIRAGAGLVHSSLVVRILIIL